MQVITANRFKIEPLSSVAQWVHPNINFNLYTLEPGLQREPHPGIPTGQYILRLRTIGQKHAAYKARYDGDHVFGIGWHRGMIEIAAVPGREAIEFHVGNTIADSEGCSLCGLLFTPGPDGHFRVGSSRQAYERAYPIIRDLILAGPVSLHLTANEAMA